MASRATARPNWVVWTLRSRVQSSALSGTVVYQSDSPLQSKSAENSSVLNSMSVQAPHKCGRTRSSYALMGLDEIKYQNVRTVFCDHASPVAGEQHEAGLCGGGGVELASLELRSSRPS